MGVDGLTTGGVAYTEKFGSADCILRCWSRKSTYWWRGISMTGYAKMWWEEVTVENNGTGSDPFEVARIPLSYVWSGDGLPIPLGKPIGANPLYDAESIWFKSTEYDVLPIVPTSSPTRSSSNRNGSTATFTTTHIEGNKWSFLPGYEPDISDTENPQPNGFPDPAWEPAAP